VNIPKSLQGKGLVDLIPNRWKSKFLGVVTSNVVMTGGSKVYHRTLLTAQKYQVDWENLESSFPQCLHLPGPSEKWDFLVEQMGPQGTKDPEMWAFIDRLRSKDGQPRRMVRDKMVTTAFVDFVVDQLQAETSTFGDFKYHDSGEGSTGEAITDVGMESATGEARSTGTQTETDHDTYKSVATDTYSGSFAITEHGLFNTVDSTLLMDRTVFSAINVVSGNQIEFTFEISFTAGG